jgi:spermidine/putrescine-binding protein
MNRRTFLRNTSLASLAATAGCGKKKAPANELNIYIWTEYLPDSVVQEFTKRTGIKVNLETYDSNEAMEQKLQSGVSGFDLVVPSDYMVSRLSAQKLIAPLDRAKLPNFKNLDAAFLNQPFDPNNTHSIPWVWGTTGLGFNKEKLGAVDSWSVLFDEKNKGRILMLDDARECFATALKTLGLSVNEKNEANIAKAAEILKKQKPLVKTYNSSDFANILASGDVDIAHGYNGEIVEVLADAKGKLDYTVPKEGAVLWMDNMCRVANGPHEEAALKFLDFVMDPQIHAQIINDVGYAGAIPAANEHINKEILEDPRVFPTAEVRAKCEFIADLGATAQVYDKFWTEIKAL